MTIEPKRLLDDPTSSAELRALLREAEPSSAMTPAARGQALKSIAAIGTSTSLLFWLKGPLMAGLLGAAGGAVIVAALPSQEVESMHIRSKEAPAAVKADPSPRQHIAPVAVPENKEETEELVVEVEPPAARRAVTADTLAAEAELLERARRKLQENPAVTFSLLNQHRRKFPRAKLGMERELIRVDALRRLGRMQEARGLVDRLLARSGGIYRERLLALKSELR